MNTRRRSSGIFWSVPVRPVAFLACVGLLAANAARADVDTPSAAPDDALPRAACHDFDDDAKDAALLVSGPPTTVAYPRVSVNPGLELLGMTLRRVGAGLRIFLKVADVPTPEQNDGVDGPGKMNVHDSRIVYRVDFAFNGKAGYVENAVVNAAQKAFAGSASYPSGTVASATMTPNVMSIVDAQADLVTFTIPAEVFPAQFGAPLRDGDQVTALVAQTIHYTGAKADPAADTISGASAEEQVWRVGDDFCFGLPPVVIDDIAAESSVQYGDAVPVAATVADADTAEPLAGVHLSFTLGMSVVSAATDADGRAATAIAADVMAGDRELIVKYAGDAERRATAVSVPIFVTPETTRTLLSARATSATLSTVTVTVLDDDAKPVTAQPVVWYVDGKRVATARLDASGRAVLRKVKRRAVARVSFEAVVGRYRSSAATLRVP